MKIKTTFTRMPAKILAALGMLIIVMWIFGDPPIYFAKSIHGQVVDEATGQPIAGGVVVAEWILMSEGFGHASHVARMNTIEAVTDKDGRYEIAGWGPKLRWPFTLFDSLDPKLTFLKSGYYPQMISNDILSYDRRNRSTIRTSRWNGETIKLKPFDGDWEKLWQNLDVTWSVIGNHCTLSCPHFLLELLRTHDDMSKQAPKDVNVPSILNVDSLSADVRTLLLEVQREK